MLPFSDCLYALHTKIIFEINLYLTCLKANSKRNWSVFELIRRQKPGLANSKM